MYQSVTLAKFLGLFFIVISIGTIINPHKMIAVLNEIANSHNAQLMAALLPTILGSWLVAVHNSFKLHWSILITILGWLMLVGGAFRAWFPALWVSLFPRFENESCMIICGAITLVIGLILFFLGVRYSQKA